MHETTHRIARQYSRGTMNPQSNEARGALQIDPIPTQWRWAPAHVTVNTVSDQARPRKNDAEEKIPPLRRDFTCFVHN